MYEHVTYTERIRFTFYTISINTGIDYTYPALGNAFGHGHKVAGGFDFVGHRSISIEHLSRFCSNEINRIKYADP